jgi:17beta-estradiol 17-dehydrogenase / very-long-chain 3-oxoacyl-CoA reductase
MAGGIMLAWFLVKLVIIGAQTFVLKRRNLPQRYGYNSWAVITGAESGIGREFAIQLAQSGFHVCLIGENRQNLVDTENIVKRMNPNSQTMVLEKSFNLSPPVEIFNEISNHLTGLDVAILVNNLSTTKEGLFFIEETDQRLIDIANFNCTSTVLMTKKLLPTMLRRVTRSAIINVSGLFGSNVLPFFETTGAADAFNDYFTRAISDVVDREKVDVMLLKPGMVASDINRERFEMLSFMEVDPGDFVSSSLDKLGWVKETHGYWMHELIGLLMSIIPRPIFSLLTKSLVKRQIIQDLRTPGLYREPITPIGMQPAGLYGIQAGQLSPGIAHIAEPSKPQPFEYSQMV